jgi:hypothetical protein
MKLEFTDELWKRIARIGEEEGWGIFLCDDNIEYIQRDDDAAVFENDDDAIEHVRKRAAAGSRLHQMALAAVVASKINQGRDL